MTTQSLIVKGSLQESQKNRNVTFAEAFLSVDALIIVDISASMATRDVVVEGTTRSRWDEANVQLARVQRRFPGKLAVVAFSDNAEFCPAGVLPPIKGGTNLHGALEFVKPAAGCGLKFIVASDGEPDDPAGTLSYAKTLGNKIDTIHIGSSEKGRKFLEELAAAAGGKSIDKGVELLEESVTKLLKS